jgi:electron transfer flavoprotein beta subunit
VAERLGLPVVTYVQNIKFDGNKLVVQRQLENGYEVVEVQVPCLLTVVKELNEPRYMSIYRIVDAYKKEITVWNHEDISLDPKECGLNASPTQVFRSFTPPPKGKGEMLKGSVNEMASSLISRLKEKHVL